MGILECASRRHHTANPVSAGQCWLFATLTRREIPNHQTCRAPTPARHPAAIGNCVLVSHELGWRVSLAHHCAAQQKRETPCHLSADARTLLWTPITGCRVQSVQPCVLRPACPAAGRSLLLLQHGRNHEPGEGERGRVLFKPVNWDRSSSCLRVPAP